MPKKITFIVSLTLILLLSLNFVSCKKEEKIAEEIVIERIMPPQASFYAVVDKVKSLNWKKVVYDEKLEANEDIVGYQVGIIVVNWTVASIIKDDTAVAKITTNWIELTKGMEIEEDAFILTMKSRVEDLTKKLRKEEKVDYKKITRDIEEIHRDFRKYCKESGKLYLLKDLEFSAWLEFLYIGVKGLLLDYSPNQMAVFQREQEINYFLSLYKENPEYSEEIALLKDLKPILKFERESLSKKDLELIKTKIENFRDDKLDK